MPLQSTLFYNQNVCSNGILGKNWSVVKHEIENASGKRVGSANCKRFQLFRWWRAQGRGA